MLQKAEFSFLPLNHKFFAAEPQGVMLAVLPLVLFQGNNVGLLPMMAGTRVSVTLVMPCKIS